VRPPNRKTPPSRQRLLQVSGILTIPLWQRGMKGDFKNKYFLFDLKISCPFLPKRGI